MNGKLAIVIACCVVACVFGLAACSGTVSSSTDSASAGSLPTSSAVSTSTGSSALPSSEASPASQEATGTKKALQNGIDYWFGINGAEFDMVKSRAAFLEAANGGEAEGWYWLGVSRMHDIDPERWNQVMSYFEKAAEEGSVKGLCGQALLIEAGFGVKKDEPKAVSLYQQAADGGDLFARVVLAGKQASGEGVAVDSEKAIELLNQAAQSDDYLVANCALTELGSLYLDGIGVSQDAGKAVECYQKASDNGYAFASQCLAGMYMKGDGVAADAAKAKELYDKAAAGGWHCGLAKWYVDAEQPDYKAAAGICQKGIEGGKDRAMALCLLADMTAQGEGVDQDTKAAIDLAHMALDAAGPLDGISDDAAKNPSLYANQLLETIASD